MSWHDNPPADLDLRMERKVGEYQAIAYSTMPADRPAAEAALAEVYRQSGYHPPRNIYWLASPPACLAAGQILFKRNPAELGAEITDLAWLYHRHKVTKIPGELGRRLSAGLFDPLWFSVDDNGLLVQDNSYRLFSDKRRFPSRMAQTVLAGALGEIGLAGAMSMDQLRAWVMNNTILPFLDWGNLGIAHLSVPHFCSEELGADDFGNTAPLMRLAESCGHFSLFEDAAFISERPVVFNVDAAGLLHGEDVPAVAYSDGFIIHATHGEDHPFVG